MHDKHAGSAQIVQGSGTIPPITNHATAVRARRRGSSGSCICPASGGAPSKCGGALHQRRPCGLLVRVLPHPVHERPQEAPQRVHEHKGATPEGAHAVPQGRSDQAAAGGEGGGPCLHTQQQPAAHRSMTAGTARSVQDQPRCGRHRPSQSADVQCSAGRWMPHNNESSRRRSHCSLEPLNRSAETAKPKQQLRTAAVTHTTRPCAGCGDIWSDTT